MISLIRYKVMVVVSCEGFYTLIDLDNVSLSVWIKRVI